MCAIAANYRAAKSELKAKLDAAGWSALDGARTGQNRGVDSALSRVDINRHKR